jgi:hypothetical protein
MSECVSKGWRVWGIIAIVYVVFTACRHASA